MARHESVRASRVAAVVCLSLAAGIMWVPTAHTATAKVSTVETSVEAWFHTADEGVAPTPLPVAPDPVNPYGENTLHVAIAGGREDARTYLSLDLSGLPATYVLQEAVLTLPVDPNDGSLNPETSRVQVCLSDLPAKDEEGSFQEPPKPDCKSSVPATYEKEPFPHLEADLTGFGTDLSFSGLALLPSDRAVEKRDTWHVTFFGKKNKTKGAHQITAKIAWLPAPDPFASFADIPPSTSASGNEVVQGLGSSSGNVGFPSSTSPALDSGAAPSSTTADTTEPGDQPVEAAATPQLELANDAKPAYTIVWALPLVLLALGFYLASALTGEIVIRRRG